MTNTTDANEAARERYEAFCKAQGLDAMGPKSAVKYRAHVLKK